MVYKFTQKSKLQPFFQKYTYLHLNEAFCGGINDFICQICQKAKSISFSIFVKQILVKREFLLIPVFDLKANFVEKIKPL
jgi:hypothetical protein